MRRATRVAFGGLRVPRVVRDRGGSLAGPGVSNISAMQCPGSLVRGVPSMLWAARALPGLRYLFWTSADWNGGAGTMAAFRSSSPVGALERATGHRGCRELRGILYAQSLSEARTSWLSWEC